MGFFDKHLVRMATPAQPPPQLLRVSPPPLVRHAAPVPVQPTAKPSPVSNALKRMTKDQQDLGDPGLYAEILRICNLPVAQAMADYQLELFSQTHIQAHAYQAGFRLLRVQAEGLAEFERLGGLFAPIPVGDGKTLLSLMIADFAYRAGCRKIILHIPPHVLIQLMQIDIPWARNRVPLGLPIMTLGGRPAKERRALAKSKRNGLYIVPYSMLSTKDTSDILDFIEPQLVIADEAHALGGDSARTKRFMKCFEKFGFRLAAMSGTITSKSILDYWHLIQIALREGNPLPNSSHMVHEWAEILDAPQGGAGMSENVIPAAAAGPIMPLVDWARRNFPKQKYTEDIAGFRKAYHDRLHSAPGVVGSSATGVGTSLCIHTVARQHPEQAEHWAELQKHILNVETLWVTPNGDELEHAIHKWKWLYELTAGFYNELTWPSAEEFASRHNLSNDQSSEILEKAKHHHLAGQAYARLLRDFLNSAYRPHLDTPFLVGQDMMRHADEHVPAELYEAWREWKDLDFEGRPDRDSRAVRVCDYKITQAVEWAAALPKNTGALLWVFHQEAGRWLTERLHEAGIDTLHCPAGAAANASIINQANAHRKLVVSMSAHGTGKNLQHFQEQWFVQWPRSAEQAEQVLGRTHRTGQRADELVINTNTTTEFDSLNFAACLNDSLYLHQTMGRQKLIYANYAPLPRIFPPAVLRQRGFENVLLTAEQERALHDKFGN